MGMTKRAEIYTCDRCGVSEEFNPGNPPPITRGWKFLFGDKNDLDRDIKEPNESNGKYLLCWECAHKLREVVGQLITDFCIGEVE
jgi:hypothetical protein